MGVRVAKRSRRQVSTTGKNEGRDGLEQLLTCRLPDEAPLDRLQVTQVTITASLGIEKLRLRDLALATSNCEYIPGQGLLMRTVNPPTAACIQRDGSMIVMGARTFEDSRLAARHFAYAVQQAGHSRVGLTRLRVASISAYVNLRCAIDLQKLAELLNGAMDGECLYDLDSPHSAMRLVWRPRAIAKRLAVLIYHNGKLLFTGARKEVEHERALDFAYPLICQAQIVKVAREIDDIEALYPSNGSGKRIRYSDEVGAQKAEIDYKLSKDEAVAQKAELNYQKAKDEAGAQTVEVDYKLAKDVAFDISSSHFD